MQTKKERENFSKQLSKKKKQFNQLKKLKSLEEDKKSLSFKNITRKRKVISLFTKKCWTYSYNRKPKGNIKWEKANGREKSRPELICWRMFTFQENKISFKSKKRKKSSNGWNNKKWKKFNLWLPSRMQNTKQERQRNKLLEKTIRWIFWNKWTKRIGFKEHIYKKKCTKKERLN